MNDLLRDQLFAREFEKYRAAMRHCWLIESFISVISFEMTSMNSVMKFTIVSFFISSRWSLVIKNEKS